VSYSVQLTAEAREEFLDLPQRIREQIKSKLKMLEANPLAAAKRLQGHSAYRVRSGDYRIIFEVDETAQKVSVFAIGNRKDVYRGF